jgi:hypothetical protein
MAGQDVIYREPRGDKVCHIAWHGTQAALAL